MSFNTLQQGALYAHLISLRLWAAVSREEENRAKIRFEKVTGKDQPFLTKKKFNDLLGNRT